MFVSEGDLWEFSANGGLAHAITSHVAPAASPALSPDGSTVAFTGTYEGPDDAYVMPMTGGRLTRITYNGSAHVIGWSRDGKVIAASSARSTLPSWQLLTIDPATREQTYAPLAQASEGCYDPSGKTLFFTRLQFQGSHTRRYQGGTAQNIWKYSDGAPEAKPLTADYLGTSKNPMWWNGRIYFLSDRDGAMNIWSMDENGGSLKQLTYHVGWDIGSAALDAGKIVYQLGADLRLFDAGTGQDKLPDIRLASDFDTNREKWVTDLSLCKLFGVNICALFGVSRDEQSPI